MAINPTVEAHYRDYVGVDQGSQHEAVLSINQGGTRECLLGAEMSDVADLECMFGRDVARDLGTTILQWAGNPSLHGSHAWVAAEVVDGDIDGTDNAMTIGVCAVDGELTVTLTAGEPGEPTPSDGWVDVTLETVDAIDLGQRLIVWAGVAGFADDSPILRHRYHTYDLATARCKCGKVAP